MRQKTILLLWSAGVIGLLYFGIVQSSVQAIANGTAAPKAEKAEPAEKPKPAKAEKQADAEKKKVNPRAVRKRPAANNAAKEIGAAVKTLVNEAFNAFRGGGRGRARAVAPVAIVDVNDAMVKQFEQQYSRQFQQLHRTELHFIRIVCRPTKQEYETIAADGEKVLKETVKKFAVAQQKQRRGGFRLVGGQQSQSNDPRTIIGDELMKSVKATLSAEQAARYQKESELRVVTRKRVAVLNILARLDKELVLTDQQREKLKEVLQANWDDSWSQTQRLMNLSHYLPQVPDKAVIPILNKSQTKVWRGMQKHGNIFFGFQMGMVQGVKIEDEVWDDDQPAEEQSKGKDKSPAEANPKVKENK